jgi:hypothetical protein
VWIPKSAAEIEEAAGRGGLEETHTFDGKAALPEAKKNHDLAVDGAAMRTCGPDDDSANPGAAEERVQVGLDGRRIGREGHVFAPSQQ